MPSEGLLALEAIHVLVVSPENRTRQAIARMLADAVAPAFELELAADLGAAVAAARRGRFDVYLLDSGIGELPGALGRLASAEQDAPIILFGARRLHAVPDAGLVRIADVLDREELSPPVLRRALRYAVERWLIEQRLAEIAHYDELTGFANRELFRELLGRALARARRTRHGVALLLLDLDGFKVVNDTLGHQAGDRLLCLIADRIKSALRESDTVARLGGDEFAVILEGVSRGRDAGIVAQRIIDKVSAPLILDGQEVFTSASIGLALDGGGGGQDCDNLIRNADMAMFRAKGQGRGGYAFHTADMTVEVRDRMTLENDLRRALARGEFVLAYQPQFHLGSDSVVGLEALIRWRPNGADVVPPSRFIPVAEETGLIIPLGEWVLHEACAQSVAWQQRGLPPLHIAVNLSARQFQQRALAETVRRALAETGLDPSLLELELTEGHLAENVEQGIATLHALKEMGVRIAIDDFGAGYSSLAYLKQFPVDTLKIDRSFVRDLPRDPKDCAIATTVISLAHNLGLTALAEGVETPEQLDWLRGRGCDAVQGYLLSRPLDQPAVAEWLASQKCARQPLAAAGVAASF